jgi:hypothetical protein
LRRSDQHGRGRDGVERMAEEKAELYALRWVGPQPVVAREDLGLLGDGGRWRCPDLACGLPAITSLVATGPGA